MSQILGATYYVDDDTCSAKSNGTSEVPFCSIQSAADIVNAGDTVIVKDGTYTLPGGKRNQALVILTRSGAIGGLGNDQYGNNKYDPSTWITFKSENPLGAVLDGERNVGYGFVSNASISYIRIEGFEIKRFYSDGIMFNFGNEHDIYIYKNEIHHINQTIIPKESWSCK